MLFLSNLLSFSIMIYDYVTITVLCDSDWCVIVCDIMLNSKFKIKNKSNEK